MSRFISDILEAREPHFSQRIIELEKIAGKPGVDLNLISDIIQKRKFLLKSLGLDRSDTKAEELYYALSGKALTDSKVLAAKIGIDPSDTPESVVNKSINFVRSISGDNRLWSLKSSVAKKQLKENPPKKLMKIFSLRSIDSALKREALSLLSTFAQKTESIKWHEKYVAQGSKLNPTDFDYQSLEISQVSSLRQTQLKKAHQNLKQIVYVSYDVAGIIIITPKNRFDGDVLFLVHSMLENIKLLKSYSLYLKLHSLETDFSARLSDLRKHGFPSLAKSYKTFGWNAYLRYFSSIENQADDGLDLILGDDFKNLDVAQVLENNSIWQHPFLLTNDDTTIISCNLSDVILNAVNKYQPSEAHFSFGQHELSDELFGRYSKIPRIRQYIEKEANNG